MRYKIIITLIIASNLFTSCFEIIEEINFNSNGSGSYKMIYNLSQSKTNLDRILLLEEVQGYRVPTIEEIQSKLDGFSENLKLETGISDVVINFNQNDYILSINLSFDKIERINQIMYNLWFDQDPENAFLESYYLFNNHQFKRSPGALINILNSKIKTNDQEILEGAIYMMVYRFSNQIISQSNPISKTVKDKNIVYLHSPVKTLLSKPSLFKNHIILKP